MEKVNKLYRQTDVLTRKLYLYYKVWSNTAHPQTTKILKYLNSCIKNKASSDKLDFGVAIFLEIIQFCSKTNKKIIIWNRKKILNTKSGKHDKLCNCVNDTLCNLFSIIYTNRWYFIITANWLNQQPPIKYKFCSHINITLRFYTKLVKQGRN